MDCLNSNRAVTWKPEAWIQTGSLNNLGLRIKYNHKSLFFLYPNSLSSLIPNSEGGDKLTLLGSDAQSRRTGCQSHGVKTCLQEFFT